MPRTKQGRLNGMELPSFPDLEAKAEAYRSTRNRRMRLLEKEIEQRAILQAGMKEHELTVYEYDDQIVVLDVQEKVKVKAKGADAESDGEDTEDKE